ncbi:MAG: hypothetical protein AAGJ52_06050 [Pseudomonadota bacterium]
MTRVLIAGSLIALTLAGCASRPDCQPVSGFELGRSGAAREAACEQPAYAEAWRLGQTLGTLESELRQIEALASPSAAQRQRSRVLQREIPELETLARLEGWLPAGTIDQQPD